MTLNYIEILIKLVLTLKWLNNNVHFVKRLLDGKPTLLSAVDAKTEYAIIDNLKETRKDKTTIITTHRLSAVVHADFILVLQNGQIIERGTHEDLLAMDGWYAQTYQSQQLEMKGEEDAE